ncbi:MAG: ABC transporter ATP-binding protein [Lachnospiraceae bacterium]|nr:ABC transporter ATP-binding protein [Candidatus Colinaster scatohippi]
MKKLLKYLNEYRKECFLSPFFKMLEATFELTVPLVIASLIDKGIANQNYGHIYRMVAILGVLAVVGLIMAITAQFFAAKAAIGFATKLRHALFEHLMGLSYDDVDKLGTSTMITRMTSDVNQAQNGVNMFLRLFLRSPFVVFGAMIMAFTIDAKTALIFVVTIVVLFAVVGLLMSKNIPAIKRSQGWLDKVTQATRENLNGVRVLRAFRLENKEIGNFGEINGGLTSAQKYAGRISALMNPLTYVLINLGTVAVIYVGSLQVQSGALSQGQVVALYNYMAQILVELVKLANLVVTLNRALASGNRIADIFEIKASMTEGHGVREGNKSDEAVVFDNVSLVYPGAGEESLKNISFSAKKGQTIGIIGGTGSGKSSLVNLIARFYDATAGNIIIDGHDIREYSYSQLHKKIGVVMQKAVLFKGTIADNLRMPDASVSEADMNKALVLAQAMQVVEGKGGLEAEVEQGGRNFSGGQRQRISIARTLAAKPEIVVLDDSSSALDYATDLALRRALKEMPEDTTVFIISQRTSSLKHADQIVVLEDGEMAGIGTHAELMNTCEVYREIHNSQLHSEEEVTA